MNFHLVDFTFPEGVREQPPSQKSNLHDVSKIQVIETPDINLTKTAMLTAFPPTPNAASRMVKKLTDSHIVYVDNFQISALSYNQKVSDALGKKDDKRVRTSHK